MCSRQQPQLVKLGGEHLYSESSQQFLSFSLSLREYKAFKLGIFPDLFLLVYTQYLGCRIHSIFQEINKQENICYYFLYSYCKRNSVNKQLNISWANKKPW